MAVGDPVSGVGGNLALGGSDPWTTVADIEVYDWTLSVNPEKIESTTFADTGIYRKWYHGEPEVTVDFNGHWPNGVAYPIASVAEGIAASTLTLTTESGKTITIVGMVRNIKLGVNRHTGLNSMSASFIGRITVTA